jgi:hypothetical protein
MVFSFSSVVDIPFPLKYRTVFDTIIALSVPSSLMIMPEKEKAVDRDRRKNIIVAVRIICLL